jgi:diguanylate cyclase (GGDEF)-like protein/PAS domain S-box-containing protein
MANLSQSRWHGDQSRIHSEASTAHRSRPLRALFVHREADVIDSCLQELKRAQFVVSADFVLNLLQCRELLRTNSYDVVVAEHPGLSRKGIRTLQLLQQTLPQTPLILLTTSKDSESIAQLGADTVADYVLREHIGQLPMAIRRVLSNKKLRSDLEEARKALRHSQSLYRALADNPAYGTYRCDTAGTLLDINQALVKMLGYASSEELFAANQRLEVIPKLSAGFACGTRSGEIKRIDPIDAEWKRKDGTTLKVRLSGRDVYDDQGNYAGHEIIVVDTTEQRTLEDQLRRQASTDSLTGLGNHRRLFEVLHAEICRSGRSGREFSLLLLDLDGLKKINDEFGHAVGSRALCRLAQILADCSRSIDTAARHGGDEFALVLPETLKAAAVAVVQRIFDLLEKDTEQPPLSVSVGIASYPRDADTIGTLLYAADKVLYAMKSTRAHTLPASAPVSYREDPNRAFTDRANDVNAKWPEESPHG